MAAPIITADRRTPIRNFVAALLSPGACVPSAGAGGSPLGAFRHGDCPAATGQDDSGRWRASSVMSTKPLFRIEGIWLVVKRHGSPSLFFRGSLYPHLILRFGILRPKAVVRHSRSPCVRYPAIPKPSAASRTRLGRSIECSSSQP